MIKALSLSATAIALVGAGFSAQAATLYNNGPVVNANGLSVLTAPATTFGFGAQAASANAVADDFTVGAGQIWNVENLTFYGYQTGSTDFTFQSAAWSVVRGDVNTGTVVASGTTALTSGGRVGYRVTPTTLTDTTRGIYAADANVTDFSLGAGSYWLRWGLTGSLASGPWQPPTADAAQGNAAQSTTGSVFATLAEVGSGLSVTLPFTVSGTVSPVPEPASLALMLAGSAAVFGVARGRRRAGCR